MLRNSAHLKGFTIRATDGELGTVDQFYFDDETWAIRYLVVETGGWLGGRQVLISPISVVHADWEAERLDVALTKKQVENSPNIDTHQPVSRQHEAEYYGYYGYPYYWGGPYLWGPAFYPAGLAIPAYCFQGSFGGEGRRESRRIRICAAPKPSLATTLRRLTAKSAMWTDLSWTMKPGRSATSRWPRGIGGRARRCWFHPHGSNG